MRYLISLLLLFVLSFWIYQQQAQQSLPLRKNSNDPGYLTVECNAQMGNQLFCFSAGLAYAWDNNLEPRFPALNNSNDNLSYNRDRLFFRLNATPPSVSMTTYKTTNPNYETLPKGLFNVNFVGSLFSWKFFHHHRERLLEIFSPSEVVLDKLKKKYSDLIALDNSVAIHVRTYSKKLHAAHGSFVGMNYFEKALERFPEDATFVVFSDRMNWTRKTFSEKFPSRRFVFIEGNDHIEDLFLMSMMKHQILSRSTYSWWGAYLNQNRDKIVVAPYLNKKSSYVPSWLPRSVKDPLFSFISFLKGIPFWSDLEYNLPEWVLIDHDIEPYPIDMYSYGDVSASVFPDDQ